MSDRPSVTGWSREDCVRLFDALLEAADLCPMSGHAYDVLAAGLKAAGQHGQLAVLKDRARISR